MRCGLLLAVMLLMASLAGCGGVADNPVSVTPPASTETIKAALNDVIASGEIGSGGAAIEMEIDKIRETDAAKADALKKAYDDMSAMRDPAQVKAKAQEMLTKL